MILVLGYSIEFLFIFYSFLSIYRYMLRFNSIYKDIFWYD